MIDDYFKEDAYFEIYQDGVLVDSGQAVNEIFVSDNLPEGWYEHVVYYEEDGPVLQDGPFYSYGNSSDFSIVNVENGVVDDDEYAVYDDVVFLAHQGNTSEENGVEGVEIAVYVWNEDEEAWYDHAYLVTDETGEAWLYNETCGQYEWESYNVEEKGYYEVWTGCDDTGGGGGDEDYDEYFYNWDYYGSEEPEWNKLIIGYDPDTDCDCDVDVEVYVDVFNNDTGEYVDSLYADHTIYNGDSDWFEQEWNADYAGKYDFYVELYDQEYGHPEDNFEFSLIMSDEWFEMDFHQEGTTVYIDMDPQTDYDGEILTHYYFEVFRLDENDEWEWIDQEVIYDIYITGSNDNEDIHFEWTAEEDGTYLFQTWMEDEYWNGEDWDGFEVEINLNSAPVIHGISTDTGLILEGQLFNFEADVTDEDEDVLEYSWDMGDGNIRDDEDFFYAYQDDGEQSVTLTVSDGEHVVEKTFTFSVRNVAPSLELSYDSFGQEGQTLDFNSQTNDVAEDTVTVTWTFPDGTQMSGNFVQYTFIDDGDFSIRVSAADEDGGEVTQDIVVTIENVAPTFTEFLMPSSAQEGETLEFSIDAMDPGDDVIIFHIDFGDGTSPLITQDGGNITHRFAEGDTFTLIICAKDEDGGENCRQEILPVSLLQQLEDEGLLPGFNLLAAISALGIIGMLRRRTH